MRGRQSAGGGILPGSLTRETERTVKAERSAGLDNGANKVVIWRMSTERGSLRGPGINPDAMNAGNGTPESPQGCSMLSTEAPVGQGIESSESGGVSVLTEGAGSVTA